MLNLKGGIFMTKKNDIVHSNSINPIQRAIDEQQKSGFPTLDIDRKGRYCSKRRRTEDILIEAIDKKRRFEPRY